MKFDVIIGNPPYQIEGTGDRARDEPIYHRFMDESYKISDKTMFITPARFLFNAGQTPKSWNEKMLNDKHLKVTHYEDNSANVFPNTDITGGITVTYRDKESENGPINTFTHIKELNTILNKVNLISDKYLDSLHFGKSSNKLNPIIYVDYPDFVNRVTEAEKKSLSSNIFEKFPEAFDKKQSSNQDFQVLGRYKNKRIRYWIKNNYILPAKNHNKYKVFVPASNGSGAIGVAENTQVIGIPEVGFPNDISTQTFITFGKFDLKEEAENLNLYLKTKFSRTLVGTKKITQHNQTSEVWKNVPLQDFTENSDIDWSKSIPEIDQQLYSKYNLTEEEIEFIESNVQPME